MFAVTNEPRLPEQFIFVPGSKETLLNEILQNIDQSEDFSGGTGTNIVRSMLANPQESKQLEAPVSLIFTTCQDFFLAKLMDGALENTGQIGYQLFDFIVETRPRYLLQAYNTLSSLLGLPFQQNSSLESVLWKHILRQGLHRVCHYSSFYGKIILLSFQFDRFRTRFLRSLRQRYHHIIFEDPTNQYGVASLIGSPVNGRFYLAQEQLAYTRLNQLHLHRHIVEPDGSLQIVQQYVAPALTEALVYLLSHFAMRPFMVGRNQVALPSRILALPSVLVGDL
jgi:hypothetical protein